MSASVKQLFDLKNKVALITGGSRGLGLQMAEALGEMGARIAITARKKNELDQAVAHLASLKIDSFSFVCDIGKREAITPLADAVPGNNTATDTDSVTGSADLSVTKSDGAASVVAGTSTTYTITLTNNGPSTVGAGVVVSDTIPANTVGSESEPNCAIAAGVFTCTTTASLAPAASVAYQLTLAVTPGTFTYAGPYNDPMYPSTTNGMAMDFYFACGPNSIDFYFNSQFVTSIYHSGGIPPTINSLGWGASNASLTNYHRLTRAVVTDGK